jgi:hypothetical protein
MFEVTPSAGEVMLTGFWDFHGTMLAHFQMRDEKVNSALYCEVLFKLRGAVHTNRPTKLAREVLLHRDNAGPHTAQQPRREFKNYSGDLLNIRLTARIWPLVASIYLVH